MSNYQINQVHLMITGGVFCLLLCVLLSFNKNYYDRSKSAILQIQFSAAVLLFTDSVGMLVDGKPGIVFRRIAFCASLLSFLFAIISGMSFLSFVTFKLFQNRRVSELPKRVWGSGILLILAILLVFVMSFTGKYFYIDDHNHYQRGSGLRYLILFLLFACL